MNGQGANKLPRKTKNDEKKIKLLAVFRRGKIYTIFDKYAWEMAPATDNCGIGRHVG